MKKSTTFLIILLTVIFSYSQEIPKSLYEDSIKIPYRYIVSTNQAYEKLRYYKSVAGLSQERLHQKDVTIQYLERAFNKSQQSDSLKSILILNKDGEIKLLDRDLLIAKSEKRKLKAQKIGIGLSVPVIAVASFLLGWYLPH